MIIKPVGTGPYLVNTYFVYDEINKKGFIVDPGGYSKPIADQIKEESIDLQYIILTHGHGDHIGGIQKFKEEFPEVKLVAYSEEAELLREPALNMSPETLGVKVSLVADIEVKHEDELKVGDINLTFIHTPGHSKGSMCILANGALFSGDTLFQASIGRTDLPGGSFEQILDSIRNRLFLLPNGTQVYPGHMGQTTIGFEKENNPFV